MTARNDIIQAARRLHDLGRDTFSMADLLSELRRSGSTYPGSTLSTHISSVMCVNAPSNHAVRYPDLERVGRGEYRLLPDAGTLTEPGGSRLPNRRDAKRNRDVQQQIVHRIAELGGDSAWPLPGLPAVSGLDWQREDLERRAYLRRSADGGQTHVALTRAGRRAADGSLEPVRPRREALLDDEELELLHQLMWDSAHPTDDPAKREHTIGVKWAMEEHFGVATADKAGPHGKVRDDAFRRLEAIGVLQRLMDGRGRRTPRWLVTNPSMVQYPW